MAIGYQEHAVHPHLRPWVACYWTRDIAGEERHTHPVMPDGCIDLLFESGGERLLVVGTMTRTLWAEHHGPTQFVGVRFRPGGAAPFLRQRVDVVTDATVDAEDLLGRSAVELRERLMDATVARRTSRGSSHVSRSARPSMPIGDDRRICIEARVAGIERFLLGRLRGDVDAVDPRIAWATSRLGRDPACRVDTLAADIGMSRQYLRRLFLQHTGISPKAFARVARLQRLAESLRTGTGLAAAADAAGYADQAHMTREFKGMVGITPAAYVARGRARSG
jgi:AraC-like DNA-binding protein